jgi:hypothetical protein
LAWGNHSIPAEGGDVQDTAVFHEGLRVPCAARPAPAAVSTHVDPASFDGARAGVFFSEIVTILYHSTTTPTEPRALFLTDPEDQRLANWLSIRWGS